MPQASDHQQKAADPSHSVWVSANAGSGKTSVLTSRVVRLLLAGADPTRLLCVTFTKAAAANMQNRIFDVLGKWVAQNDADLATAITDMTGEALRAGDLGRARRLFARAVETPGGLKIQTIHGFCERLLHQFPFEAGVPARFTVMDEREQQAMTEAAITATLNAGLANADGALGEALRLATSVGEEGFRKALRACMMHRRERDPRPPEAKFALSPLQQRLGVAPGETVAGVEREILEQGLYTGNWRAIADWLKSSGKSRDSDMADFLQAGSGQQGERLCESYLRVFLTSDNQPRLDKGWFVSGDLRKKNPDLLTQMLEERERVHRLAGHRTAIATLERTEAIIAVADAVLDRYNAQKRRLGRLDFPDLISKVVKLLTSDTAGWVLYKLDQGLDHILVDEAQDTSPQQWAIVKALADDFFAGEGARGLLPRTIFAVGDEKQSIFGFQGARPEEFDAARRHFSDRIKAFNLAAKQGHAFENVRLQTSYRSVADVLTAVDQVFAAEERYKGLSSASEKTVHVSNRLGKPGLVELWEPIVAEKREERDPLAPVDATPVDAPAMRLARAVARRIAFWQQNTTHFEDDGLPITPGDIVILVRNRGPIFEGVIKALKQENVPVAGADRMKLNEQIAVLDLLALGRFCLLLEDDLTLAALLKSPLLGLDEEELLALAHGRGAISLWESLRQKAAGNARFAEAARLLAHWRALALQLSPHAFYATLLSAEGCRRKLTARLGVDCEEAISVFLATLRQWQTTNPPSLLGFIEAMAQSDADVKRDMEEAHGRIRVMTVHAAKGLEARIVFLIDTLHNPKGGGGKGEVLLRLDADDPETLIWSPSVTLDPPQAEAARQRLESEIFAESRRLLYVALTRARDRLYIAGARGPKEHKEHWQGLIDAALKDHANLVEVESEDAAGKVWQWRSLKVQPAPAKALAAPPAPVDLPPWLLTPASVDLPRPPPLRPSRLADAAEPSPLRDGVIAKANARLRGDLIHHLLQHLPDVQADKRPVVALQLSTARFPALDSAVIREAIASTLALMAEHRFAALFSGDSRAEVAIAGRIMLNGENNEVAGRIDRLAITDKQVTLVDFKTGRPPSDPAQIPVDHLQQLAIYEALLGDLYPDRAVVTAIIWTALPEIVIVAHDDLQAAMQTIKVA